MKIHPLITTTEALSDLCARLAKSEFVAVDTEFMRENTYWPELCLVQIANTEEAAAIDPMAEGIDLTPLLDLMCENEDVLKVFHAGSQDVEIRARVEGYLDTVAFAEAGTWEPVCDLTRFVYSEVQSS